MGLNGGPVVSHSDAFSFQVSTRDQAETDRYLARLSATAGKEGECGWCKDKWGISCQITPIILSQGIEDLNLALAKRIFDVMITMCKIGVGAIERAIHG